ncbi:malate dehydrogenase (quinone) [Marinobacter sp. es.042]|uniref:malate dehydrogenase (quinone) n=1 Tax=Marinobacter sp. es.042 TaxID=1761794 RepID=UPI000B501901|nr:malate dehydrogenase (quinone) [Marinobacter sp. es.042]SNB58187.1 malate dehydrogenase (quinone) [Marinobacter sp. es.042]
MTAIKTDVLLIGGGIMSTTLATLITELDSSRSLTIIEQSEQLGQESSDAWNNAGTGHAGYCELNYTPQAPDGTVSAERALDINERFEVSLQFWGSLAHKNVLPSPESFIRKVPHLSWVKGKVGREFLANRQSVMVRSSLFEGMEFSDDQDTLERWLPLITRSRTDNEVMSATRVDHGSDVDFGALTRSFGSFLRGQPQVSTMLQTRVVSLKKQGDRWSVTVRNSITGELKDIDAGFVFVGAGGASLPLLQKAGVEEAKGYGGFPVSGIWLACHNEALALAHSAKVYSQAEVGAPPMSVPHLDTRYIDGKPALLFGPFAGFTTRFLKAGSLFDLIRSVRPDNLSNLMHVAATQWPLTRYLIKETLSSRADRLSHLAAFMPAADHSEWRLRRAGQRVQIIKTGANGKGALEFGTEVLTTADGSLAALLGASPGASTGVSAMLTVIERCLPELTQGHHRQILQSLIPSYGHSLKDDPQLLRNVRAFTHPTLGLMGPMSSSLSTRSENHADRNTDRDKSRREPGRDHTGRRAGVA